MSALAKYLAKLVKKGAPQGKLAEGLNADMRRKILTSFADNHDSKLAQEMLAKEFPPGTARFDAPDVSYRQWKAAKDKFFDKIRDSNVFQRWSAMEQPSPSALDKWALQNRQRAARAIDEYHDIGDRLNGMADRLYGLKPGAGFKASPLMERRKELLARAERAGKAAKNSEGFIDWLKKRDP